MDDIEVEAKHLKKDLLVGENKLLPPFHLLRGTG